MTIPDLISQVLEMLRNQFYLLDIQGARAFKRDERYLIGAIATYGYECKSRNWHFDADFLFREISTIIQSWKHSGAEIIFLPIYLQSSIRRHIGQRAEEHKAAALFTTPKVAKLVAGLTKVEAIREKSDTEILATLYVDVQRQRRREAASRRSSRADKKRQTNLL